MTLTLKLQCEFLSYEESSKMRFLGFRENPLLGYFAFERARKSFEVFEGFWRQIKNYFFFFGDVSKSFEQIGANRGQISKDFKTDPKLTPKTPQT